MTGPVRIGSHRPARRVERSVEEHPLDALVIVEVLDVPQVGYCRPYVRVQIGRAVPGNLQVVRGRQGRAAQELADPAAPGHIELQAVHRADEPRRVGQRPAVLAGRDVGPHLLAHCRQAREVL